MAEWDFESALNEYFGTSAEDGDAPLWIAPHGPAGSAGGSATFSAPSGWDFDKALNDYFGGVNGYVAPRGYESPDAGTRMNAPWEFSPPSEPPPPPSDYDQAVWFNALQRRHEAWDQAREQQELLSTPVSQLLTPQEQADWAEAYRRSQAHAWTPEQMTGFGYGFRRAEEQGDLGAWLERLKQPYEAPKAAPAQAQPYRSELYQLLDRVGDIAGSAPEAYRNWYWSFYTPEERKRYEENELRKQQAIQTAGDVLGTIGGATDVIPGVKGAKDLAGAVLEFINNVQTFPRAGGLLQQEAAERPEQTALALSWLNYMQPGAGTVAKQLFNLNLPEPDLQRATQEARVNPLTLEKYWSELEGAPSVYTQKTHPAVQFGLSSVDPSYWALGLAGRGLVSGARSLAGKAAGEGGLAERLKPVLSGIKPHRLPGTGAPGALEEALPKVGDTRPTARGEVILQPSNNVKENLALANQSRGVVERGVRELEREVPGFKYVGARVKANMERIGQKVSKQPPNTISDYLGVRGSVETLEQIDPVIERLDKRFGMVQVDPFLSEPRQSGYFGVHVQIKTPNGLTAEVQILPREVAEVKEAADELYSIRRGLDVSTEDYQRLLAEEKEIFAGATRKFRERTGITDQDLVRIERELKLRYSHLLPRK